MLNIMLVPLPSLLVKSMKQSGIESYARGLFMRARKPTSNFRKKMSRGEHHGKMK